MRSPGTARKRPVKGRQHQLCAANLPALRLTDDGACFWDVDVGVGAPVGLRDSAYLRGANAILLGSSRVSSVGRATALLTLDECPAGNRRSRTPQTRGKLKPLWPCQSRAKPQLGKV